MNKSTPPMPAQPHRVTRDMKPLGPRWSHWIRLLIITLAGMSHTVAGEEGFEIARPGRVFEFPKDHASHPAFSIEWWYVTGHLNTGAPQPLGFQATFFRRATSPIHTSNATNSISFADPNFGHSQIFLAHMALTDPNTGQFWHRERIARDGWDAWARTNTLDVRHGNWSIRQVHSSVPSPQTSSPQEVFQLRGSVGPNTGLDLQLEPAKPRVLFGTNGVSRKATDPAAASHYITYTRLHVHGQMTLESKTVPVTGLAWFDHEFSSSQLGEGQVGWDWASIQLKDGREIMAYRMRRSDGSTDPFSTLAWIDRSGKVHHHDAREFQWESLAQWKSPVTGASYPNRVRIRTIDPETQRPWSLVLNPRVANQELRGDVGGISYWEGACRVEDEAGVEIGRAYLELTGYDGNLRGRF